MSLAPSSTGAAEWRGNRAAFLARYAPDADPAAFADAWRRRYSPSMEEVRSGRRLFVRLDVCIGKISGRGPQSYLDGIDLLLSHSP